MEYPGVYGSAAHSISLTFINSQAKSTHPETAVATDGQVAPVTSEGMVNPAIDSGCRSTFCQTWSIHGKSLNSLMTFQFGIHHAYASNFFQTSSVHDMLYFVVFCCVNPSQVDRWTLPSSCQVASPPDLAEVVPGSPPQPVHKCGINIQFIKVGSYFLHFLHWLISATISTSMAAGVLHLLLYSGRIGLRTHRIVFASQDQDVAS